MLANTIEKELRSGIAIGPDIMNYMMSVSGIKTIEDIQQILLDENSSEGASLFELMLFPDEKFQIAVEPLLEHVDYSEADEKTVCKLLISRKLPASLHFPFPGSMSVTIPPETIQSVVTRLNITKNTDIRILDALHQKLADPLRSQCQIRLRNSKWIQSEENIRLLHKVIESGMPQHGNFLEDLNIILEFLTCPHPESDIEQALVSERERLVHLLDAADIQEHLLKTFPVEAVMLQGVRIAAIDRDEFIRRLHVLDRIRQIDDFQTL